MDVERLARKLAPLMPEKVRSWKRMREHADVDLRLLMDRQLISMARHALGDFENKLAFILLNQERDRC